MNSGWINLGSFYSSTAYLGEEVLRFTSPDYCPFFLGAKLHPVAVHSRLDHIGWKKKTINTLTQQPAQLYILHYNDFHHELKVLTTLSLSLSLSLSLLGAS
jgi:hypothetical protein